MGEHFRTAAKTVATGADQTFELPKTGSMAGKFHFGNITGLTCTIQASYDKLPVGHASKVYTNIDTYTNTGTKYAAGATVTTADDLELLFFARGVDTVKVTFVGGTSGPVHMTLCDDGSELVAAILAYNASGGAGLNAYGPIRFVEVTCTLDTNAYADNDVLFDSQIVAGAVRQNDGNGWLVNAAVLDEDDQTAFDLDLVLLKANVSIGTENDPVSITDANAREIIDIVSVTQATNPSVDLVNNKRFKAGPNHNDMPVPIRPVSGSDDIYIAGILRSGTPTFTANGLRLFLVFKDA